MAKADIWMPLFIGDYLADTTRLTTEQHGAYLLLIMDYWRNGAPPDDDLILSNITKMQQRDWKKTKNAVMTFFTLENGAWVHSRIEKELEDAAAGKKKAEEKAKKAAEARWGKASAEHKNENTQSIATSNAPSILQALHEECPSQSPSPSLKPLKSKTESATASRLPADWMPSPDDIAFCERERPELSVEATAHSFRDYWIAVPGVKGRKVDWAATWRNWVRNERATKMQIAQTRNVVPIDFDAARKAADQEARKRLGFDDDEDGMVIDG